MAHKIANRLKTKIEVVKIRLIRDKRKLKSELKIYS